MNRSLTVFDKWKELVDLVWCALRQSRARDGVLDEDTFRFFTPSHVQQHHAVCLSDAPKSQTCEAENPAMDSPTEDHSPTPAEHRRLEKLLPRPFASSPIDTTATRKQICSATAVPHLSHIPLYHERPTHSRQQQWTIFTYLPSSSPPSPKELFIHSVAKAIEERLSVHVTLYSCYNPSFSLHLPIAIDDSDVVLFFVDSHLQSTLLASLESVQTFSRSSQQIEAPFTLLGAIHGRPLRAVILHTSTHEEPTIKSALWQSLKALAL